MHKFTQQIRAVKPKDLMKFYFAEEKDESKCRCLFKTVEVTLIVIVFLAMIFCLVMSYFVLPSLYLYLAVTRPFGDEY